MISLEQIQLLETRVSKAIGYVERVNAENAALISEKAELLSKVEANQRRIDELEVHIMRFKEDQGRIEDGIIAALDRLSQFEEAFEKSLKNNIAVKKPAVKAREKVSQQTTGESEDNSAVPKEIFFEIPAQDAAKETASEGELDIF